MHRRGFVGHFLNRRGNVMNTANWVLFAIQERIYSMMTNWTTSRIYDLRNSVKLDRKYAVLHNPITIM